MRPETREIVAVSFTKHDNDGDCVKIFAKKASFDRGTNRFLSEPAVLTG